MTDLHAELAASLKRRGATPPAEPYASEVTRPQRRHTPAPRNTLSPEDRQHIRALRLEGREIDEIHAQYPQVSRATIYNIGRGHR